jgi:hypothetical protein
MQQHDFSKLFDDGRAVHTEHGTVTLARHSVGDLVLSTGALVACDPFTAPDTDPFTLRLPPGTYPLVLSVANYEDDDRRVAGAMLQISSSQVVSWELALLPDQSLSELEDGEIFGYGVDSGTGCFMDEDAAEILMSKMEADDTYFETIIAEMDKTYTDTWSWANIEMNAATRSNLIAFSSGMGDGFYASYIGRDIDGNVVSIVTDFALFTDEEMKR